MALISIPRCFHRFFGLAGLMLLAGLAPLPAHADKAEAAAPSLAQIAPVGPVLLTIQIPEGDGQPAQELRVDLAALQTLPSEKITTSTIWTSGVQQFEGLRLARLVENLGITKGTLYLWALNEYMVELPVEDLRQDGALIAYRRNGAPMTARDKGPLWLVYPYDSHPRWQSETIYAQSIWQLDRIELER